MHEQDAAAMTVRDVARVLSVDEKTVYRLVQSGPARVQGRRRLAVSTLRPRPMDLPAEATS